MTLLARQHAFENDPLTGQGHTRSERDEFTPRNAMVFTCPAQFRAISVPAPGLDRL